MRYEEPLESSSEEILKTLKQNDTEPSERIRAVLSAIFYGDSTEFAGDVLIEEFSAATYVEKINLVNLFETFYQSNRTTYRIDESIAYLETYMQKDQENSLAIKETINALTEFKAMFVSR